MSRSGVASINLRGPWKVRWENFLNKQRGHKREIGVEEGKPEEEKMFDHTHTPAVGGEVLWVEADMMENQLKEWPVQPWPRTLAKENARNEDNARPNKKRKADIT